jgi:hypothetical protein
MITRILPISVRSKAISTQYFKQRFQVSGFTAPIL